MTTKLVFILAFAAFAGFSAVMISNPRGDFLIDGPVYAHSTADLPVVVQPQS